MSTEPVSRAQALAQPVEPPAPRSAKDWANEILSWASPDGLLLRATQPILADALRRSGAGAGTEWGPSLQRVLDDPRSVPAFQGGFREGVFNGAKSLVEGTLGLAAGVAEAAYNTGPLGWLVEGAQRIGVVGEVPRWVPDAGRVTEKAQAIGEGVGTYLAAVGHDPAKLGNDVKGWIAANWQSLKADHAAAAGRGGAAEAQWWGQITGRATFEVAALVVPVTKFATVAKAGEALNIALKAGKLGETFAQAAKAGKLVELFGAATKAGKTAELVVEARTAGRLSELAGAARSTTGGLEALVKQGGVTLDEIAVLQKGGVFSATEAKTARVVEVSARRSSDIASAARETGISPAKIADILATSKPDRPLPATYLTATSSARALARFDDGAIRITSRAAFIERGTLGPPGGFVMPAREFESLVKAANGDLRIVENKLGLTANSLSNGDMMIAHIQRSDIENLRLPSGNESGANQFWLPGGVTSGGVSEAVMDFPKATIYREISLNGGGR